MQINIYQVLFQFYLLPYIKITHSRLLNGDYEFIIGWLNTEVSIAF